MNFIYFQSRKSSLASAVSDLSLPESVLREEIEDEEEPDEIKIKDMQEDSSKGKIHGSIFWKYLFAGGNFCFVFFVTILYALSQVMASGVDYFVSFWINIEEFRNVTNVKTAEGVTVKSTVEWSSELCLYIYGGALALLFLIALARSMLFYKLAMISSQKLHDTMFTSVLKAPMRFFDTNPSGRILNRFSKDMGAVDELLPKVILDAGQVINLLFIVSILIIFLDVFRLSFLWLDL